MAIKFQKEPMNAHSSIKHVIGVVSGKGGVGKSFVTASMAAAMRKKGYEGIIIVTSPQELVQMIVKKAYNMAGMMNVPVLGIVENYSYLKCPDCGKEISLFGESHIDEIAADLDLSVLGKLPLDPAYAKAADAGQFYTMDNPYIAKAIEALEQI